MMRNNDYKKLNCIIHMGTEYIERFEKIVDAYADKLSDRVILNNKAMTLHDFNHHCFNIYSIISNVIFDKELVYLDNYGISPRNLYILNLAVLFHDIGMFNVLGATRGTHSKDSGEYIKKENENSKSAFKKWSDLTNNEVKALRAIVVAHSDIKDKFGNVEQLGLQIKELRPYRGRIEEIETKFLAGILRLADELDISSDRLGNAEIEVEIEEGKKEIEKLKKGELTDDLRDKLHEWEGYVDSLKYWKRLHYIAGVQKGEDPKTIEIIIDDDYIEHCLDIGMTEKSIAREIAEIYQKVDKELGNINLNAFTTEKNRKIVALEKIVLVSENDKIKAAIENCLNMKKLQVDDNVEKSTGEKSDVKEIYCPKLISETLNNEISKEVNARGLLCFGHYLLNKEYCARDWINIKEIIETKVIINRIIEEMVVHFNSSKYDDYVFVGIDYMGGLIASRIAFALQKPLTYIISGQYENDNANQDIQINIKEFEKVILITDVIVTYQTIKNVIDKYSLENRVLAIYTLFYRPCDFDEIVLGEYVPMTYSVNNTFKIELFQKNKCIYKNKSCFARNRKICSEEFEDESGEA